MLALDQALGLVGDLYLYGDHADPNRFYYAPGAPTIALSPGGDPEYRCVVWKGIEADGAGVAGALLGFTSELRATEDQLKKTRALLEARGGTPVLGPIPLMSARGFLATALAGEDGGLVEHVLTDVPADTVGTNRATFGFSAPDALTARLVASLVRAEGASPIGVRYELEYIGLRPAFEAHIRADYQRAYHELSLAFKLGFAYQGVGVKVGIEHATRRLRETGALEVEVTHFTDDAALQARLDAIVRWFQEDLQRRFFTSALHPPATHPDMAAVLAAASSIGVPIASALGGGGALDKIAEKAGISPARVQEALMSGAGSAATKQLPFQVEFGFSLKHIDEDELRTETIDLTEARAERRTLAPQGLLSFMGAPRGVVEVDVGAAFPELRVQVRPLGDFAAVGAQRLVVEVAWPDETAPRRRESYVFEAGDAPAQLFAAWTDGAPATYRYRVQVHFVDGGPWPGDDASWISEWTTADRLDLAVHPLAAVPRREVEISLSPTALEGVLGVEAQVRVEGTAVALLQLDAAERVKTVRRRVRAEGRVEVTPTWRLADGNVVTGDPIAVDGPACVLGPPWRSRRRLRLVPMLPAGAIDAAVTVSPQDGSGRSQVFTLTPGATRAEVVDLPSLALVPPPVRIDVLIVRGDGTVFTGEPFDTTDAAVVITDRDGRHRRVVVKLLAPASLAAAGVLAVLVQLVDDADQELDRVLYTESARGDGVLLVPEPEEGPFRYSIRVTRFSPLGVAAVEPAVERSEPTLLIPAAAPAPG